MLCFNFKTMKKSLSLVLITIAMTGLVACGGKGNDKKVSDSPVKQSGNTGGAMVKTNPNSNPAAIIPAGTVLEADLEKEISSGKNKNDESFILKIKNGSIGKYQMLKDAKIEGHLENVAKAAKGKKAKLNLVFDDLKLKNGDVLEINADLLNTSIESKTQGKFLQNAGIILGGAAAGHFLGGKTKFKHGTLAGGAAATAFVLSSPGGEVVLKKGTDIKFKLKSNVDAS